MVAQHNQLTLKSEDQAAETLKQQQIIVELQKQVQDLQGASQSLQQEAAQANKDCKQALDERTEAATAVIKLDEARILLNKLLGPQGPLQMSERHKFLSQGGAAADTAGDNTINDRSAVFYTNAMTVNNN